MLRLIFIISIFSSFLPGTSLQAQDYVVSEKLDKRSKKLMEEAEALVRRQQFDNAIATLNTILAREPKAIDALILRGDMYYSKKELALAERDLEAVLAMSMDYKPRLIYQLGLVEYGLEKYEEAAAHHRAYLLRADGHDRYHERVEKYLRNAEIAAELRRNPVPFSPESMGPSINTPGKEYLPAFSADGRYLVYTVNYTGREDFYYSELKEDGTWSKGQALTGVNTVENEGAQSMSADGRLLYFTGCNWPDSYGSCDLYYARREKGQWGNLRHAAPPINSEHWDTQPSLSANGDYLYFTSTRPGGFGGSDIWRCKRGLDGRFGSPENLGPTINTEGNEQSPFLHADGQTLYFASDTHPGLGDFDIFISRMLLDGSWGEPKNIGYPINTSSGEGTLVVSLDGKKAYYTTDQNTKEGKPLDLDIYQFDLYWEARPQPLTYVEGRVLDAQTDAVIEGADVLITAEGKTTTFAQVRTLDDGTFLIVLPMGENYALEASREGYLFYSDRFELAGAFDREKPYRLSIPLQPVPEELSVNGEQPIVLKNVLFVSGSAELLPMSEMELNRLVQLLKNHLKLNIRINGHTDNVGDDTANQVLSEARAKSVYNYLIKQGIAAERLSYKGFGESQPIAENDTPEGRKLNRRTEFEVISLGEQ
ncbi:OmpA family protein [Lewinella sp. LCG006]|uniref:OmpA family protein n=1 Tax=Lewinella sp. LCG006 TaxID=3231911 RepID=UPI00345F1E59